MQKVVLFVLALVFGCNLSQAQVIVEDCDVHACAAHKASRPAVRKSRASNNAVALMSKYDVTSYHLNIECQTNTLFVRGNVIIAARAINDLDSFAFELHGNHNIDSVVYNGAQITVVHPNDEAYALLPSTIPAGTAFSITIYYNGTAPQGSSAAIGNAYSQDNSPSWGNEVVWSLSQPYFAHEWWPCKQFLQDKADSCKVYITTADSNMAGSNGVLVGVDVLPGNQKRYRWHNNSVIDYYLISVAVSQYVDYSYKVPVNSGADSVLYQNFVYNNSGTLPYFKSQIDSCGLMITYLDSLLTPYPYKDIKYGHCMAPFGGGMEHQTMTSLGSFSFDIDGHELMHQWFGDHVTCRTWRDIWINEGWASYGEFLVRARFRGPISGGNKIRSFHNSVKSLPGGSIYTTDTSNARVFDSRLSYSKGGAVIHTLRFYLGDSLFFAATNNFLNQYGNATASINEFKASAEATTGMNLTNYFNEWIFGEGYPIYSGQYNSNGTVATIKLTHTTSTSVTPLFTGPLELKLYTTTGDTTVKVNVQSNTEYYSFFTPRTITGVMVDPNNWICDDTVSFTANETLFPLGMSSIANQQVIVAPNPAQTQVVITGQGLASCQLYTIAGALIKQEALKGNSTVLNVANVKAGTYLVRITMLDGSVSTQKLLIQ
jgi:aminopeptidase N